MLGLFIIFVVFGCLPAAAGTMSYYSHFPRYLSLVKWRREIVDKYILYSISVVSCWILLGLLASLNVLLGIDVKIVVYGVCCLLLVLCLIWLYIEFPIVEAWKKLKYWIVGISTITSLVIAFFAQIFIDELIVDWTGYQSLDFSTSQLVMNLLILPAFWTVFFSFLMVALYTLPILMIILSFLKMLISSTAFGRSALRFVTLRKVHAVDYPMFVRKLLFRAAAVFAVSFSLQVLPPKGLSYFSSEEYIAVLKEAFIKGSYHSDATLCANIDNKYDLKIALLSKDRISIFKEGESPEFTKAKCTFSTSPYITK